jgi:hypothetical protein
LPNSGVDITPGAGAAIAVNAVSGLDYQVIKADWGADGASIPASSDGTNGLDVHVKLVDGVVVVNNPTAANLKVDASGATVPVSAASALPVSAPDTAPVSVRISNGSANVDTLPVSGTVTANQGTAAATANAWPVILSDGTHTAPLDTSNSNALKVSVVASVNSGDIADDGTFTEGTTLINPIGGEYNSSAGAATSGKAAACQITQYRGLHVNLRAAAGTEIGSSSAPLRVDPVGTTTQPVSGTVTADLVNTTNAGAPATQLNYNTGGTEDITVFGIALPANGGPVAGGTATNPVRTDPTGTTTQPVNIADIGGSAPSAANPLPAQLSVGDAAVTAVSAGAGNPLPTLNQPSPSGWWRNAIGFTAGQTAQALHTPASGKTGYIEGFIITVTTAGVIQIYDGTNSATTLLYDGYLPVGAYMVVTPSRPLPQAAVNNVLRYTSDSTVVGTICIWGYDA